MILLAHIVGIPIEELLLPWTGGNVGATIFAVLASAITGGISSFFPSRTRTNSFR